MENEMRTEELAPEIKNTDAIETKNQHPDRIKISPEALTKLGKWNDEISRRLRGVKLTRSDLVNFLILNHEEQLSSRELGALEKEFFDEVKFAQWAVEELKSARSKGEQVTLAEIISTRRATNSEAHPSSRPKRNSKKNQQAPSEQLNEPTCKTVIV